MSTRMAAAIGITLFGGIALSCGAEGFEPAQTFRKGALVISGEAGYGEQFNLEDHRFQSDIKFWNAGLRLSLLPLGPTGSGFFKGALEVGLEPFYQHYTDPKDAFFAGVAAVTRYHFLSLGRFVPYVELSAAAGGTDLDVREIRSDFTFLLFGGLGASVFVTDRTAVYAGYRYQHVSNGNIEKPNRGFESNTGVLGLSYFFP